MANFTVKGQIVNILGFLGHRISIQLLSPAIIARKITQTKRK